MTTRSDLPFFVCLGLLGGVYLTLIAAMLVADAITTSPGHLLHALATPEVRYAIRLSLLSSLASAILSVWVAVPLGYLLARTHFPGKAVIELLIDVPIVLPPLVVGLSLLVLFQTAAGRAVQDVVPMTYAVPGVVLAQFTVAAALAVRTMRVAFEQTPARTEQVALTLGCTRAGAFWRVALPEVWPGVMTAATLAWARSIGEFGPVLVFAGATRMRTEVMPTTVFLELNVGNLEAALAVSLVMILVSVVVLLITRAVGKGHS